MIFRKSSAINKHSLLIGVLYIETWSIKCIYHCFKALLNLTFEKETRIKDYLYILIVDNGAENSVSTSLTITNYCSKSGVKS